MTPHTLRMKILAARQQSIRRLRAETFNPELTAVLDAEAAAIQREILRLQVERQQMAYCGEK